MGYQFLIFPFEVLAGMDTVSTELVALNVSTRGSRERSRLQPTKSLRQQLLTSLKRRGILELIFKAKAMF
jgi:hypothetical protein